MKTSAPNQCYLLRDYQEELVSKTIQVLRTYKIAYLTLETRVGKTPVSLVSAERFGKPYGCTSILFCTKKSVIPSIEKTAAQLRESGLLTLPLRVISFDSLHKERLLLERIIIVDEAHSFGAYPKPSLRAKNLRLLSDYCPVILLSATPTPESYSQIYHQLWACNSPIFPHKSFYKWAKDFVKVKQKRINAGQSVNDYSDAKFDLIQPMIDPITISYTQEQAGFNHTEVSEIVFNIPAPDWLYSLAKAVKTDRIFDFKGNTVTADTAASVMSKTHQLFSGTVITDSGEAIQVSSHKLDKIPLLMKAYRKLAIFYKFMAEYDALKGLLGDQCTENAEGFAKHDIPVYLGQFQSKREGIDLKVANAIVFYNIDHAYLSYEQTKNRIQSIDRETKPVLIFLFTEKGIEERIYKVVKQKKNYTTSYFKRWNQ